MKEEYLLDFAADVGKELLENGAETSRVEDTLERIIHHLYDGYSEVFVVLTGIFVNIGTYTKTIGVKHRTINLDRVSKINMLSRDIVSSKVNFEEAKRRFEVITASEPYPQWAKTTAAAICCGLFTLLQRGTWYDAVNSFIIGAAVNVFVWRIRRYDTADFIVTFASGAIIALAASLIYTAGFGNNINAIITGSIMPLVPGLAITNALRDILAGDYLSGSARLFDATVTAVALAGGAGAVMYLSGNTAGGLLL